MFELSSSTLGERALIVTFSLSAILILFFAYAAMQSRRDIAKERVASRGYGLRKWWGTLLISVLAIAGTLSFLNMPYPDSSDTTRRTPMKITAMQYAFMPSPASVPVGPARIEVTAADVNHGVGIYTPGGTMIAQVQAMPGKVNVLETEFPKPGVYHLLCMEYCGVGHHQMLGVITVTDRDSSKEHDA